MTAHELARKLLEGQDVLVVFMGLDIGPQIVEEIGRMYVDLDESRTTVIHWTNQKDPGFEQVVRLD